MVRAAKNQALCREVNERIENLAETYAVELDHRDFICECADDACSEPLRMTVAEYEAVRTDAMSFVVRPGDDHVVPDVEVVVARNDRYWVVHKMGVGAEVAERLNPRSRDRRT